MVIEYVAILTAPPLTIFNQNNSLVVHLIKVYDLDPMDGTCNVGLRFLHLCDKSAIGAVGVDSLCFNGHGEVVLDAISMD
jgi:hypothetical protein